MLILDEADEMLNEGTVYSLFFFPSKVELNSVFANRNVFAPHHPCLLYFVFIR